MSSDAAKKRKLNDNISGDTVVAAGVEDIIAEMKVQMTRMQNEMFRTLSQMDELKKENKMLETGAASMQNEVTLLKNENKCLKARCSSLERSMQILIKERKWEYSAPDIPESHWEERDFDEDYIACIECFLKDVKKKTCDLRNGGAALGVDNDDADIDLGTDIDIVLLHDDLLLPHWKELTNAMQMSQKEKPFTLSICNLQLSASVIDFLKPVLEDKPIESIVLRNNSFVNVREGRIEFAVEVIESNEVIKRFNWTSNTIHSIEDAQHLVESIISHPSIDCIRLENCFVDDTNGYAILRSLLMIIVL